MTSILQLMGSDHRACDGLFATAEDAAASRNWEEAGKLFRQFHQAMDHHFAMEEEVLFPAFEEKTGSQAGPTMVMRMEHQQMRTLMQNMDNAVNAKDEAGYLGLSETLNMFMQQHNFKEENVLYPMTDQALAAERDKVIADMGHIGPAA